MTAPQQFPAFISVEYDGRGGGFPAFGRAVDSAFNQAQSKMEQFSRASEEVGRVLSRALTGGPGRNGGLDLQTSQFREAAAQARYQEAALRELQRTTAALAATTGDTSQQTKSYMQAIAAQMVEARQASAEAKAQVATYTRLQAALDTVASQNSRLAASYREVYSEQAKAAQREVVARETQAAFNQVFAPGLTRSATASGAGFGAIEEMLERRAELERRLAQEAAASAAASERARAALEAENAERQRQIQLLEDQAREQANIKANNDRFTSGPRAIDNGAGYSALAAELDRIEQKEREAALAAQQYKQALFELRQQVDPASFAMERFQKEVAFANIALEKGDISATQHASRMAYLSAEMQRNATSTRQARFASVQLGQQLQDMVIQAQMGTNAFVILAQQGSQVAFALAETGGAVGKVARFMAGWQGAIVFAAAALAGPLLSALFNSTEATKAAEEATKKHKDAVEALQNKLSEAVKSIEDKARADYLAAETERLAEIATRKRTQALLEQARVRLAIAQSDDSVQDDPTARAGTIEFYKGQIADLQKQIVANDNALAEAEKAATRARGLYQGTIIERRSTAEGRVNAEYDRRRNEAIERGGSAQQVAQALQEAVTWRDAELKKIQETNKAAKAAPKRDGDTATPAQVSKILLERFGGQITSTTGGRHVKGSYHYKGQAVDFVPAGGMGSISKAQIRQVLESAGLTIKELLGPGDKNHSDHFHVAWSGGKGNIDSARIMEQIARQAEQAAADMAQLVEGLIRRYDEGRAVAIDYEQALADINTAVGANAITQAQANSYILQADMEFARKRQEIADKANQLADFSVGGLTEEDVRRIMEPLPLAGEYAADALMRGANAIDRAFGGRAGTLLTKLAESAPGGAADGLLRALSDARKETNAALKGVFNDLFKGEGAKSLGKFIGSAMGYASVGMDAASLVLGGNSSKTGSAIGGVLGKVAGQAIGKTVGGTLGKALGPLGSIAGGILGGMLGGLFKKTKIGYATIGADASGGLGITKSGGNSASRIQSGDRSANTVIDSIEEIAAQLGASVDASRGSVSIGMSGDSYHVDTTGQGRLKKSQGGKDFNQDAQAAVAYAIQDLIKDGVLVGLRQGTERLLKDAVDLSAGLSKALKFEGVFRDLKRLKDPVAAAIDDLKTEFDSLRNVFKDAGASTEEYAQLEELYQKKRKMAVEEATKALTGSLKDLLDQITIGDSGYSLRTRLENARAAYDPLAARVKAGDATAYDDYANAAQTLLDLQRQYSGSTEDYFTVLDQVKGLTKSEYDRQMSLIEATTAQTEAVVGAIVSQTSAQVQAANDNAARLEARMAEIADALKAGAYGGKLNF